MDEERQFEKLKELFVIDTENHIAYIKSLSFEDVETDKRRFELIEVYCKAMDSTMALVEFVNAKQNQIFFNDI